MRSFVYVATLHSPPLIRAACAVIALHRLHFATVDHHNSLLLFSTSAGKVMRSVMSVRLFPLDLLKQLLFDLNFWYVHANCIGS